MLNKRAGKIEKMLRSLLHSRSLLLAAAAVVFITTYALILPALTLEQEQSALFPGLSLAGEETLPETGSSQPAGAAELPAAAAEPAAEGDPAAEAIGSADSPAGDTPAAPARQQTARPDRGPAADLLAVIDRLQQPQEAAAAAAAVAASAARSRVSRSEAELSAAFVRYCLEQADIDRSLLPVADACAAWVKLLQEQDLYQGASYLPTPGDLVFIDADRDARPERMGVVSQAWTAGGRLQELEAVDFTADRIRCQSWGPETVLGYVSLEQALKQAEADKPASAPATAETAASENRTRQQALRLWSKAGFAAETALPEQQAADRLPDRSGEPAANSHSAAEAIPAPAKVRNAAPAATAAADSPDTGAAEPALSLPTPETDAAAAPETAAAALSANDSDTAAETDAAGAADTPAPAVGPTAGSDPTEIIVTASLTEAETAAAPSFRAGSALKALVSRAEAVQRAAAALRPAQSFAAVLGGMEVTVQAPAGAFPPRTRMRLRTVEDGSLLPAVTAALGAVPAAVAAVDISFLNPGGEELQPELPVQVSLRAADGSGLTDGPLVMHVDETGAADIVARSPQAAGPDEAVFAAEDFSVYALVYTVDFCYGVNGQSFACSLRGGGGIALSELVQALGLVNEDETALFLQRVAAVSFSDPSLLSVSRVEQDATFGTIKSELGLDCQYSPDLSAAEIAALDAQALSAPDWALISLRPFATEETLTVSLSDGEVFTVQVTDAQLQQRVISAAGETYLVTVTYDEAALIPEGAELSVSELTDIDLYLEEAAALLNQGELEQARFFDISILAEGRPVQPAAPVQVELTLEDLEGERAAALHFGDRAELLESEGAGESVSFETTGFSVYGIVTAGTPATADDVSRLNGATFCMSIDRDEGRYYFKDVLNGSFIARTSVSDIDSAGLYTFEQAAGTEDQFRISTGAEGEQRWLVMRNGSFSFTDDAASATVFTVEQHTNPGSFYIYAVGSGNKKYAWTVSGSGFNGKTNARRDDNKVVLTEAPGRDPYGLDGQSFGIVNNKNTVSGTALLAAANGDRLRGLVMPVRTEPIKRTENVFVAQGSDITMWNFSCLGGDRYYITAEVDNELKYLSISDGAVSLKDAAEADASCIITVEAGAGVYSGKYKFSCGGRALAQDNGSFKSIADLTTNAKNANVWMNLAELSALNEDDFVTYTAEKVSVSGTVNDDGTIDYDVKDGDQIIVYTRIWNDETKHYDYYTVDYDGMLVRAYESGNTISWVGSRVNTMLWNFTEYHYDDGSPNFYYELQNDYSGKYLAPQVSGESFLSDHTVGINLNGRRNGQYFSTVLAWDDSYYDYASLRVEDWQLTSAPISKADTFYFAVMTPTIQEEEQLTQVATVDHRPFGITIRMQDYDDVRTSGDYRSWEQINVLGDTGYDQWHGSKDLLERNLQDDGYPIATATGASLGELYDDTLEVNQQFLLSTYKETGYFEFDSTQNFAHLIWSSDDPWIGQENPNGGLYAIGDFVIYDQLATSTEPNKDTLKHGQFLPYNDITEGKYSSYTNDKDIHAQELSSLDPRKGEKLYAIDYRRGSTAPNYVDHFFGMEMSASFMQSASGLDDWGHDLIFEFSGDDDFWLYIDDMLVLDLGGVHSALDGSINFRTGKIIENGQESTLREAFQKAYLQKNPEAAEDEVEDWLNDIFKDNGTVFKDYSGHTMRMFYMERGAGASNLHMRFNLAPYEEGEVLLEKEVSGVEEIDPDTVFPFQILYQDKERPDDAFVYATDAISVTDTATGLAVPYCRTYTVGGLTYEHVFLLHPGQTVSIKLPPDESAQYQIRECGMADDTYDRVTVNGEEVYPDPTAVAGRSDYQTEAVSIAGCKKVIFDNHVSNDALRTLTVTKKLWEDMGKTRPITAEQDGTGFRFRIYLGQDADGYTVYNTGKYHVKDPEGHYCIYQGGFVSTGETDFSRLSDEVLPGQWKSQQEQATFYTSPGGAVDKIPAGYSVEIPGLMSGTPFFVEEQANDIPAGYRLIDYTRDGEIPAGETSNSGVLGGSDVGVTVHNQHGYGLTVDKIWSDADFMASHDPIYFAVYLRQDSGSLTLLEDSLRELGGTETSISWFFPELAEGLTLNDYLVYEVSLTLPQGGSISVDPETGAVSGWSGVTRIEEGGVLTAGGVTNEHGYSTTYDYTCGYLRGFLTAAELAAGVNSRTDKVSNSRPGIRLVKTDLLGQPLAGGRFSLVRSGDGSAFKTFTSGEDGLIAVAYLTAGAEYLLTETAAPYRYLSLVEPLTISVDSAGTVYVNGATAAPEGSFYTVTQVEQPTAENMPTVTVMNKPFALEARKVDAVSGAPIAGVSFELHREVRDYQGYPMPDYPPLDGFAELTTGEDGLIPHINVDELQPGNYYLRETDTPALYKALDCDIRLLISQTGQISVERAVYSAAAEHWVFSPITDGSAEIVSDDSGSLTLYLRNQPAKDVQILKKGYGDSGPLAGAEFALYGMDQVAEGQPIEGAEPLLAGLVSGEDGLVNLGALPGGTNYYLFETAAPEGYIRLSEAIVISVTASDRISAWQNGSALPVETIHDEENDVDLIQITVYNTNGVTLPATGGPGPGLLRAAGLLLVLAAAGLLLRQRPRRDRARGGVR